MARTSSVVTVGGEAPFKPPRTMPEAVEFAPLGEPYTVREELPLELRLKRQREIIHARRGDLKRFLSPREAPFRPLRGIHPEVKILRAKGPSTAEQTLPLELRLKRQREIIHARRGELQRFLSPQ